jgi:hypothetical protein
MTGARWSSAQTSRLNSMISRIGEVATTEAVRKPPIATSGGSDQSGGEISTAISPTTSPGPIVATVSPSMTTSAVPLSMAYSEYPMRPSAASNCPGVISSSDAMLATAESSSSGKSAKKRIAASRKVSIFADYTEGPPYATSLQGRFSGRRHLHRRLGRPLDDQEPLALPVDADFFAQLSLAGRGSGFADIDAAAGQAAASSDEEAAPATCPIGRSTGNHGHYRRTRYIGWPAAKQSDL